VSNTGLMRIQPREQTRPRRTTPSRVVELRKAQPISGESIQIRRGNFTAISSDVSKAHIVGQNNEEIRPVRVGCECIRVEQRSGEYKTGG